MKHSLLARMGTILLGMGIIAASIGIGAQPTVKKIRIIYTNDTMGYLEPACTCPGRKAGGLARSATLIKQLVADNPNCVIVDSGNLSDVPKKLEVMMPILRDLGYDAVGLGEMDMLGLGDGYLEWAEKSKLTVVSALPDAPKPLTPYLIKNVNGIKVGIVSFGAMPMGANANQCLLRRSYYSAYKQARDASDILVVLDQANIITQDWLQRVGTRLGAPDIVVAGVRKIGSGEPEVIGKTRLTPTSDKTKEIGVMDVELTLGQDPKYVWTRVKNYWDAKAKKGDALQDEQTNARIVAFLRPGEIAPKPGQVIQPKPSLAEEHKAAGTASLQTLIAAASKPYYPPSLCKACHVKEYEDWAKTKHATAITSLLKQNRMQSECVQCHSEQFRRTNAINVPTDGIGGVECASCHIDALPHGLERKAVATKTRVSAMMCLDCHTKEHSPGYDEQAYFPKISHLAVKTPHTTSTAGVKPQID